MRSQAGSINPRALRRLSTVCLFALGVSWIGASLQVFLRDTAQVTIVALTGWGQESDRLQSREAGCNAHLVKPVDFAALERLLAQIKPDPR